MTSSLAKWRRRVVCGIALAFAMSAGAVFPQAAVGTGAFPNFEAMRTQLKRGASTKSDVQRLLGVPNGSGGALLPGFGEESQKVAAYQIWYYEDIEMTDAKSDGQLLTLTMRQQILAVFFKGDVFHGYFWTSNRGVLEAR